MKFWLIVFMFTSDGEFVGKDIYEAANKQQCVEFASQVTKTLVNTKVSAQFHCVSDDHYMGRKKDKDVDYD